MKRLWGGGHLLAVGLLGAAGLTPQLVLGGKKDKPAEATTMRMDERKHAVHALNRMTFGPRPGDMERVTQMGVDKWIELELHPDKIDDSALEATLGPFRTPPMAAKQLGENFAPTQLITQTAD